MGVVMVNLNFTDDEFSNESLVNDGSNACLPSLKI